MRYVRDVSAVSKLPSSLSLFSSSTVNILPYCRSLTDPGVSFLHLPWIVEVLSLFFRYDAPFTSAWYKRELAILSELYSSTLRGLASDVLDHADIHHFNVAILARL